MKQIYMDKEAWKFYLVEFEEKCGGKKPTVRELVPLETSEVYDGSLEAVG